MELVDTDAGRLHTVFTPCADAAVVNVAAARPSARVTGIVYLAYVVIAGIGQVIALRDPASPLAVAVQVGGTMWYAIAALMLCHLFGDPARGAGALALVSVVIGCVIQSLYYALGLGREAEVVALVLFGGFLVFLGYLVILSALIPRAIGVGLIAGGVGSLALPVLPAPLALVLVVLLAGVSEIVLLVWLLVVGTRRSPGLAAPAVDG